MNGACAKSEAESQELEWRPLAVHLCGRELRVGIGRPVMAWDQESGRTRTIPAARRYYASRADAQPMTRCPRCGGMLSPATVLSPHEADALRRSALLAELEAMAPDPVVAEAQEWHLSLADLDL